MTDLFDSDEVVEVRKPKLRDLVLYRVPVEAPKLSYDVPGIVYNTFDDPRYASIHIFDDKGSARLGKVFRGTSEEEGTWRFDE